MLSRFCRILSNKSEDRPCAAVKIFSSGWGTKFKEGGGGGGLTSDEGGGKDEL